MDNTSDADIDNDELSSVEPLVVEVEVVRDFGRYKKYRKLPSPQVSAAAYQEFVRKRNELNECKSDYMNIRRECYNLDSRNDVLVPVQNWYWPPSVTKTIEFNEDDDLQQGANVLPFDTKRVNIINEYLRQKYRCCYWCGCIYLKELEFIACPGNTNRLHQEQENNVTPITSTESD